METPQISLETYVPRKWYDSFYSGNAMQQDQVQDQDQDQDQDRKKITFNSFGLGPFCDIPMGKPSSNA